MGVLLSLIEQLQDLGVFGSGNPSILDIGSSNLYIAPVDRLAKFLHARRPEVATDAEFLERLSCGASYDPVAGGKNESFIGELFERAGMYYASLDIAKGYRTTILDLNRRDLPFRFRRRFDVVINSGTTEHLMNQYNAFKVMHDALRAGGYIVHSLPCRGFSNHGYLTYTPRFFFDLAAYNNYGVVSTWLSEGANDDIYAPLRDYSSYFPTLTNVSAAQDIQPATDVSITIVFRKTSNAKFIAPMEQSTSVGFIPVAFSVRKLARLARRALR